MERIQENWKKINQFIRQPIFYRILFFSFFSRAVIPIYTEIMYYWLINVTHFTKFTIAILTMVSFISLFFGTMIFMYIKHKEYWIIITLSQAMLCLLIILNFLFVARYTKQAGIPDIVFAGFSDVATEVLH